MELTERMDAIAAVVTGHRYVFRSEDDLQQQLADLLAAHGHDVTREVYLAAPERIDLVVGGQTVDGALRGAVGIEVKVAGSVGAVLRQVTRYARSPIVAGLLLVTTRAHHLPATLSGKPVRVVSLLANGLA